MNIRVSSLRFPSLQGPSLKGLVVVLTIIASSFVAGCDSGGEDFCGLPGTIPEESEVATDMLVADFSPAAGDDESYSERGSWGPGPSASIEAGLLSIIIARDETGTEIGDLIERGAFPICVPLRDRSETSGQANYVEGGFVTNDNATGNVSILGIDGDRIVGRFEAALENTQGEALSFSNGAFRIPQR